jgi:hypothetical protein
VMGTPMNFGWSCRHRWEPWKEGRTLMWRVCERCGQDDSGEKDELRRSKRPLHVHLGDDSTDLMGQ